MLRFFVILDPLDKNERIYSDFYALFKPILAIIVGGLNRSAWVDMLRFQHFLCIHINKSLNVGKRFCTPYIFIGWDTAYIGAVFSFIQIVLKDILEHTVSYGSAFRHTLAGILKPFLTIFFTQGQYTFARAVGMAYVLR